MFLYNIKTPGKALNRIIKSEEKVLHFCIFNAI